MCFVSFSLFPPFSFLPPFLLPFLLEPAVACVCCDAVTQDTVNSEPPPLLTTGSFCGTCCRPRDVASHCFRKATFQASVRGRNGCRSSFVLVTADTLSSCLTVVLTTALVFSPWSMQLRLVTGRWEEAGSSRGAPWSPTACRPEDVHELCCVCVHVRSLVSSQA